jgi:hypothetical protein
MKFHTVNTITNGVLPTEANVGQKVEWDASLVDLETGEVHRTFKASGVIEQFTYIANNGFSWKYVVFADGVVDGRDVVEMGVPVGFFR